MNTAVAEVGAPTDVTVGFPLSVRVMALTYLADQVLGVRLARLDGKMFPAWTAGSHAEVELASGVVRSYSLCGDPTALDALDLAVLKEPNGGGGSREIHDGLRVGDRLTVRHVRNHFEHVDGQDVALIAGGIGITPIISHLRESLCRGERFRVLYTGRSLTGMSHLEDVRRIAGEAVTIIESSTHGRVDVRAYLQDLPAGAVVYCCGPATLIADVIDIVESDSVQRTLVIERFEADANQPATHQETDGGFEVELATSGKVISVGAEETILGKMIEAGVDAEFFCEEGYCGTCESPLLEGVPDHRDSVLSKTDRESGKLIMPCVSRALSKRLVIER